MSARWIAVKDRLPTGSDEVIYWDGEDVSTFIPVTGPDPLYSAAERCADYGITHWMPLPPPPE